MTFNIKPCETQKKRETISNESTINIPSNKENELAPHKRKQLSL